MILQTDRKQRNCNYLTLIKNFNEAFDIFSNDIPLEKSDLYALSMDLVLPENEDKADELIDAIMPLDDFDDDDNNNFELLLEDGDCYLSKNDKILPVASKEEVAILYSMLVEGDLDLMLDDVTKAKLQKNLETFFDKMGEKPVNLYSFIDAKGKSLCADNASEIKATFDLLNEAVENGYFAKIEYLYNDEVMNYIIQPVEFIYSQLDLRMRCKAFIDEGYWMTFYLSYIKSIELIKDSVPFGPFEIKEDKMKTLVFSFPNDFSLPERVAARFSDYEKEIKYNKKSNTLTYHVEYADTWTENARIINRLRSLGKFVNIESSEKDIVKADALKALELYK